MKTKALNLRIIELVTMVVIWMVVFSIPFFNYRIFEVVNWGKVWGEWMRMFAFLVIFIANMYFLVPKFLFRKKYVLYIVSTLLVIFGLIGLSISLHYLLPPPQPMAMPPMDFGPGMPPMELGSGMPAPMGYRPSEMPVQKSLFMIIVDNLILAVLVVGIGTAIKMINQWLLEEGRRKDLEKEQLRTELAMLRHQVSPHFFMNTLNNIHALVDINTESAKDAIIRLSTLMRYLLYDTAHGQTSLKKEIEFIESYVVLMQLRFSKKVVITLDIPANIPDIQIPPMLFISFLENAFKHGVSYQSDSFVSFRLQLEQGRLNCWIRNSLHKNMENADKIYSGIGLTNVKKSLDLLYDTDYTLHIQESETDFEVLLNIPIG